MKSHTECCVAVLGACDCRGCGASVASAGAEVVWAAAAAARLEDRGESIWKKLNGLLKKHKTKHKGGQCVQPKNRDVFCFFFPE